MPRSRTLVALSCMLVVAAIALGGAAVTVRAEEPTTHTVRWGETLSSIAYRYHVTLRGLVEANNLRSANVIYAGQRLIIPEESPVTLHVVRPGDSLLTIAREYGVSIWAIAKRNNIYNVNLVFVGQSLAIPLPEEAAPTPTAPPAARATPTPAAEPATAAAGPATAAVPQAGAAQEAIVIASPKQGTTASSPLTVTGWAAAAENTLALDILDEKGVRVGQGFAIIDAEMGEFGPFEGTVAFNGLSKAQEGLLQVYSVSPSSGAIEHLSSVTVRLRP